MKLRSLRLEQFRKFEQAVMVEGFGDGLNLIAGPNETGKSTLLLALRAALFERHGSKAQAVKDFAPHRLSGARPTITLAFEIDRQLYRLEKSFLSRPAASLETPDGQRFQGSAAEAELKRVLGLDPSEKTTTDKDSPAHFGVLLTPQTRSFQQPAIEDGTRHSLEAAIAEDIAELGSQSEVDQLLDDIDAALYALVSKRGEPKGRYGEVATRLAEIEQEIDAARRERGELDDQFERLQQAINERRELTAQAARERLSERLTSLEAKRAEASRLQALENRRLNARQRWERLGALVQRLDQRRKLRAELAEVEAEAEDTRRRAASIEENLAERDSAMVELDESGSAIAARRRRLEALGQQIESARHVEQTLAALATDVRLDLDEGALDRVTINGEPAAAAHERLQVTEGLQIAIAGVGRIAVEPKTEPLREALAAKQEVDARVGDLLESLDLAGAEPDAIEAAWQAVNDETRQHDTARADIETALGEARHQAIEAKAALKDADDRRARLMQQLAAIETTDEDDVPDRSDLEDRIAEAKATLETADHDLATARQSQSGAAPASPVALDDEIERLRAAIERRQRAIEAVDKKVVGLEATIAVRAGLGLDERLDQLDRQRHRLTEERDAFMRDRKALSLLQTSLREAAAEAKATFNAPLSARLTPHIQELFPGATPLVTPDFSIRALDRNGREEPFHHLSDGTREQIAILARLAYADMLQAQGLPALVVLDDALTFSDKDRLTRLFAILEKAARRLQIIILTCHGERFAGLDAKRLDITPAPAMAA